MMCSILAVEEKRISRDALQFDIIPSSVSLGKIHRHAAVASNILTGGVSSHAKLRSTGRWIWGTRTGLHVAVLVTLDL